LLAKATGGEAGVPTIAWDSNAMKGSLVGQSEGNVRTALKVISAVSDDATLWIATCNSVCGIPTALRRRFGYGTYFVDLPDENERNSIWWYYIEQYVPAAERAACQDDDWTGAEIRTCCELAADLDCTLQEASRYIVPVAQSMPQEIDELRQEAEGRYLSASYPSVYRRGGPEAEGGRAIDVEG
jgi:SpoVK/Ycf46/Vps4 family AAA+-type ATPase